MVYSARDAEKHALFQLMERTSKEFDAWIESEPTIEKNRFDRVVSLFALAKENVVGSDPLQTPTSALVDGHRVLTEAYNEFTNYRSNGSDAHLNQFLDKISQVLRIFPVRYKSNSKAVYQNVIAELSKKSQSILDGLVDSIGGSSSKLAAVTQQAEKLRAEIEAERNRISEGLGNVESQFTSAQATRSQAFQTQLDELAAKRTELISQIESDFDEFFELQTEDIATQKAKRDELLDEIQQDAELKHSGILDIYGIVGRDAQIGGYSQEADNAQAAANFWDRVVFAAMIVAIFILVGPSLISYAQAGFTGIDWMQVLTRLPISTVLFAPAGYAVAQARRQKKIAENARERQLQLAALGPYLSALDAPTQEKIRAILTPRFFSSNKDEKFSIEEISSAIRDADANQ
ncbi:hypothetical protein WNY37_08240 [Henriciella sp. AS95]|uniref:hypothetical protein n=1 Tax=Henriciella sp. AS95 TaxID=3135782 RepID=UPI00317B4DF6